MKKIVGWAKRSAAQQILWHALAQKKQKVDFDEKRKIVLWHLSLLLIYSETLTTATLACLVWIIKDKFVI